MKTMQTFVITEEEIKNYANEFCEWAEKKDLKPGELVIIMDLVSQIIKEAIEFTSINEMKPAGEA